MFLALMFLIYKLNSKYKFTNELSDEWKKGINITYYVSLVGLVLTVIVLNIIIVTFMIKNIKDITKKIKGS